MTSARHALIREIYDDWNRGEGDRMAEMWNFGNHEDTLAEAGLQQ